MHISAQKLSWVDTQSHSLYVGLELRVAIIAHNSFNRADDILRSLMTCNQHLNSLNQSFTVETHQVLQRLHFIDHILGQILREWWLLLPRLFVKNDHQTPHLLQILHLRPDEVLVSLDTDYWYAVVAHVCHDIIHAFSQFLVACWAALAGAIWPFRILTHATLATFATLARFWTSMATALQVNIP